MSGPADDPDRYLALADRHRDEVRIRSSRFIGNALPVLTGKQAREAQAAISRDMHDATHHCWAYRLSGGDEASSDAGEPSGTAGRPILGAIGSAGLSDTLVVVTRYFGGIKLGTGGLARAYREAAALVLEHAPREERFHRASLEVVFGFPQTGLVEPLAGRFDAVKVESEYGEDVRLVLSVRRSRIQELAEQLGQALRNPGAVRRLD